MPKIVEYDAPIARQNLSDRAIQAWDTAGRRIGPSYNQAAQEIAQAGHVQADVERSKAWPFNIAALYAHNAPKITNSSETSSKVGISTNVSENNPGPPPASPTTTPEAVANDQIAWSQAHGEASAGAVGISRLARAVVSGDATVLRGGRADGAEGESTRGHRGGGIPMIEGEYYDPAKHDPSYDDGSSTTNINGRQYTPFQMDQINHHNSEVVKKQTLEQARVNEYWGNQLDKWNTADQKYAADFARRRDQAAFERDTGMQFNGKFDPSQASDYREKAWQANYDAGQKNIDRDIKDYNKLHSDAPVDPNDAAVRDQFSYRGNRSSYDRSKVMVTGPDGSKVPAYTPPDQAYHRSDISLWAERGFNAASDAAAPVVGAFSPTNVVGALKDTFNSMFGGDER